MTARRTTFLPLFLLITSLFVYVSPLARAQDTLRVKAGWNIIGSVKAGTVPEILSTLPDSIITTAFFGYAPGSGYYSEDTLDRGVGYWVKVDADGFIVFNTSTPSSDICGVKVVMYAGKAYRTVKIGSQCWFKDNLNVGEMVLGATAQTDNAILEKYCYNDDSVKCSIYGGLYQWSEAMGYDTTKGGQGICPPGWHIPTKTEFDTLATTAGGDGNRLKEGGLGIGFSGMGTNTTGFSSLVGGLRGTGGSFGSLNAISEYWSSTQYNATFDYTMTLYYDSGNIIFFTENKAIGFSVRCLED